MNSGYRLFFPLEGKQVPVRHCPASPVPMASPTVGVFTPSLYPISTQLGPWLGDGTGLAILSQLPNEPPCQVSMGTLLLFVSVDSGLQPIPLFSVV